MIGRLRFQSQMQSTLRALLAIAALFLGAASAIAEERPDLDSAAHRIVAQTNEFRLAERLTPTTPEPRLLAAARAFADHMARTDRYGHEADGRTPPERAEAQGYDYCIVAENIAFLMSTTGTSTDALTAALVEGWKRSPEHRRNMLIPEVIDTAVAIALSPVSQRYYAVQLFGRPRSAVLRFSVVNASEKPLAYRLGAQRFDLPQGATRTHEQCRADALTVDGDGRRIEPVNGGRYTLEATAQGGVGVRRD
jgi:uncharacterized protein YkwD